MRIVPRRLECMTESEMGAIVEYAIRILDEVGLKIHNAAMCRHLAEHGARWDGGVGVRFPRAQVEDHLARERRPAGQPPRPAYTSAGGISGYPLRYFDFAKNAIVPHTARTVADLTRIADFMPNIEGIGSVGVPSGVPALLRPFWMRFLTWRYCGQTLSKNS